MKNSITYIPILSFHFYEDRSALVSVSAYKNKGKYYTPIRLSFSTHDMKNCFKTIKMFIIDGNKFEIIR